VGFLEEIDKIQSDLPSSEELRDVQDYLTGSFAFALERNTNLVGYAVRARRFKLGFDYIDKFPDLIRSVTREDVRRVAEKHLHPDRVVIVSAGAG
jgi:zinc protease